ncbi:GerMN domain-containing protein [Actinacidiphila glaucinigra]|uniref:hypothetical protein n=1 Tax=Actinacidiphila glaucinigra TaxID=235986 RepID=UPI002DD9DAAE|nr:hypothetical protein [Actinacidiphila glaucinigra]WSD61291.1 GerMN domain-containing protein [Actinacidiphila glaucinigra]
MRPRSVPAAAGRRYVPALVCAAAALLTGCGVPGSGVVEAGGPATVDAFPGAPNRLTLFFLSPEGRLTPVLRATRDDAQAPPVPTAQVVTVLLDGPEPQEGKAGLGTGLPSSAGPVDVVSSRGTVRITLPFPVRRLKDNAVRQVVCTAAYAEGREDAAAIVLAGSDGTLPPARCGGALPGTAPSR